MTLPTFVALGAPASGVGDVTPGLPTGHTTNDILLLAVETAAQAVATPTGYTIVPNFPIENATATTRLSLFYKFDGGSEAAPTVTDPGDHAYAVIVAYRGVDMLNPFHQIAGLPHASGTTAMGWPGMKTSIDDCMIVNIASWNADNAGPLTSVVTNSSLASLTTRQDAGTIDGNGGGLIIIDGTKATRGSVLSTTCTLATSSAGCCGTIALTPTGGARVVVLPPIDSFFIKGGPVMSDVELGDTVYYRFCTVNADGSAADADSTPTVDVDEDGSGGAAMGSSVADIGTGIYRVTIVCTSGNGYEVGKRYNVMVSATVGGRSSSEPIAEFMIRAASATAGTYPAQVQAMDANTVTASAIADNAIDAGAIASDAITAAKIATGAITAAKFAADAITSTVVADNTITAAKIAADAITAAKVADGTIDAATFAAGAITASAIAADAIGASELAADAVTEIQSGLATSSALSTAQTAITAIKTKTDSLTFTVANQVDANALSGGGGMTLAELLAYAHDTGATVAGLLARLEAYVSGKATGLNSSNPKYFMKDETTAAIDTTQNTSAGTREDADITGSEP